MAPPNAGNASAPSGTDASATSATMAAINSHDDEAGKGDGSRRERSLAHEDDGYEIWAVSTSDDAENDDADDVVAVVVEEEEGQQGQSLA